MSATAVSARSSSVSRQPASGTLAEATDRLDLRGQSEEQDADLQDLIGG